ncbi:MAG: hypothetical protein RR144_03220 [Clostridia bacterium]
MKKINKFILNKKIENINKKNKLNSKRGAELVENILMIGIAIALIVVMFYPQISILMQATFDTLETWFYGALGRIGQVV